MMFKFFQDMTIKNKLVFIIISTSAFTIILGLLIYSVYDILNYKKEMKANATLNATLIGEYCSAALLFDYKEEANQLITELKVMPEILNACIYNKNNEVFAVYNKNNKEKINFSDPQTIQTEFDGKYLHVIKPILHKGENIGSIYLRISTASINEKIIGNFFICFILLIILSGPVFLLASRLQRIVSEPILKLAAVTNQVSKTKDYSIRIFNDRKDSIGLLYDGFNEMIEQIEKRQIEIDRSAAALKKLNEELEERVKLRTNELEKTNKELIQTEKAHRDSEERLRNILNHAPILVYINDLEGRYLFVNQEFERLMGISYNEIINKTDAELFPQKRAERNIAQNRKVIETKQAQIFENASEKNDGTHYFVDIIFPIADSNNQIYATSGWTIDITDRKKSEDSLKKAKEIAETANKAKSAFLSNMSHELRTPLNAILGFSQLLLRDPSITQNQLHNLNIINQSGEHLLALINDVLEMSKIEAGMTVIRPVTFDLINLISGLKTLFQVKTKSKGIEFHVKIVDELPQFIVSDEHKVRQILINLLGNAIKFTDEGFIQLNCGVVKDEENIIQLYFEVIDSGIGVSPNDIERIFNYFEQSYDSAKNQEGTGLGLAISRQYARLLGGDVTVKSELGKGSTFRFELKAKKAAKEDSSAKIISKRVKAIKDNKSFNVLVADDRDTNRELLVNMLTITGFTVKEAKNGKEAIDINNSWKPQLILMDMVMPMIDGFEATMAIKSNYSENKPVIIAITASVLEEDTEAILSVGADDFIRKPFKEEELFFKIGRLCNLEFIYEDIPISEEMKSKISFTKKAESKEKQEIPKDLFDEILEAALKGSGKKITAVIKKMYAYDSQIADLFQKHASVYDYKKIVDLVKSELRNG